MFFIIVALSISVIAYNLAYGDLCTKDQILKLGTLGYSKAEIVRICSVTQQQDKRTNSTVIQYLKDIIYIIAGVLGAIAFYRTWRIQKRLDQEPYFKSVLGIVAKDLIKNLEAISVYSRIIKNESPKTDILVILKNAPNIFKAAFEESDEGQRGRAADNTPKRFNPYSIDTTLNEIKGFLDKYNAVLKHEKKLQKLIRTIYKNGEKLQRVVKDFDDLIFPLTLEALIIDTAFRDLIDEKMRDYLTKFKKEYLGHVKDVPKWKDTYLLTDNFKYVLHVRNCITEIDKFTSSIENDFRELKILLNYYGLKYNT